MPQPDRRLEELAAWTAAGRVESPVELVELAALALDAAGPKPIAGHRLGVHDAMEVEDCRRRLGEVLQRAQSGRERLVELPRPPHFALRRRGVPDAALQPEEVVQGGPSENPVEVTVRGRSLLVYPGETLTVSQGGGIEVAPGDGAGDGLAEVG